MLTNISQIIYLKYGELTLKGKNRINFIDCLYKNIVNALKQFKSIKIIKKFDSMEINCNKKDYLKVLEIVKRIPGILQIIEAFKIWGNQIKQVKSDILSLIKNKKFKSFKVVTKRHDKSFSINSMEYSKLIGEIVLKNIKNKKVIMDNPDLTINIEIHSNNIIIFFERIDGVGGFPIGINGKALSLISGGIDSPIASSLVMKKGMHVDFVTFITPPHTSNLALKKVKDLIKIITLNKKLEKPKIFVVNFTMIQHELTHISDKSYQITLMRRYFFRIANYLKNKYKYDAIVTGESLGQVASQTIESIQVIENVLDNKTIVLRPLLIYDKMEIIKIARKLKTYDVSILPYADCCALFVPKSPITKPRIRIAKKLESELSLIDKIFDDTITKYIKIID
ncbi:MAG: tRNA 4-thiouridine(8) synthase ThiI [Mycoplasma sp.]|nr:tRNA 4-thiouridine(8) synthase ThiI [Mycoplasma sp.]